MAIAGLCGHYRTLRSFRTLRSLGLCCSLQNFAVITGLCGILCLPVFIHDVIMKISLGKFLHFKLPCLFIFFLFLLAYISGSLYWILTQNVLTESSYLEIEKCPLCFGESLCPKLLRNQIKPSGVSKAGLYDVIRTYTNTKIHLAVLEQGGTQTNLVLKKLGTTHDLNDFEDLICSKSASNCDISVAANKLSFIKNGEQSFGKFLQGSSKMFFCPSTRLLYDLLSKYKEMSLPGHVTRRERLQIWMTAVINQEPLMLQVRHLLV